MVSLKLNKKRLLKDIGEKESDDLFHRIAMMGVEVEGVTEDEVHVDITPNRPDLLSQPGLTRALLSYLGKQPGLREYKTTRSGLKVKVDSSLKNVRPHTACAVVRNLDLDEEGLRELIQIQEKLHVTFCRNRKKAAIGVYPLEHISGNITFRALPKEKIKFRPLESAKEMRAEEILTDHPKGREYAHLLEGLDMYPVFQDSKNNILSMPPVINSHLTGRVDEKTKEIFIESSGHDFRTCHEVIRIMCAALADMGATIHTVEVVLGKNAQHIPDMATQEQEFYRYYVNRRLGLELKKDELPGLLAKMGLGFRDGRIRETHYALIPPYRVDFLHQIDVVEDIAIAYGYENIHAELPRLATVASEDPMTRFKDTVRQVLIGHGLLEAKNYHLLSRTLQEQLHYERIVTLKSSVSEEHDSMRRSIIPCLLQTLTRNRMHEYPQDLFEIGTVFTSSEGVIEEQKLSAMLAGDRDYTHVRQLLDSLLRAFGLMGTYRSSDDPRFLKGRAASIFIDDIQIGVIGEISAEAISLCELKEPACAFEISLDALLSKSFE